MANRVVAVALRADVGQYVAGMGKAAATTASFGSSVEATQAKTSGGLGRIGQAGLLAGGALVAGLGMAIAKASEFESAMSAVSAATGATGAELEALRQTAIRAGADTQYSAKEAADGITEMAKAGVSAADIMNGGLDGALALAAAGQIEVAQAAELASAAMVQFGLSGENIPHVADLLAAGAGKALGSVDDLGQALNQAGLIANAAGLSIEETTAGLAAFASAGLLGSDAGTSFKTMLQALQAPSGKSAELMAELGLNMYDANGRMLSLEGIAGQLQTRLGDLTDEQRNSALATIFGSDAVRAANVLYREGAQGIADWTADVNDAGFASDQARKLTDNLAGDIERLSGAIDSQFVQAGGAFTGILRESVQGLTAVVQGVSAVTGFISDLPAPVLVGAAALGTMALVTGPLAGAFTTLAAQVSFATGVMGASGGVMAATRAAASGLLTTLGGPLGLAVAGAAAGLTLLVQWLNSSDEATQDATRAADDYTTALTDSNGAITDSVRAAAAKAAQDAGLLDVANDLGIAEGDVTRAITDQGAALDRTREQLEEFIAAHTTERENNYGITTSEIDAQGQAAQEALTSLNLLAETTTNTASSEAQLAAETAGATGALDEGAEAADSYSDQMSEAKKAVDELVASLAILTGANNSLLSAENAVGAAIDAATGALDDQGGTVLDVNGNLNSYSENGRAASDVLLDLANSSNELISTMIQQGASVADVTARDAQLRASFIQTAGQMGITGANAERLADQIYGIPAQRATQITADTSQAERAVQDFVARVTGTTVVLSGDFTARPGVVVRKADGGAIYGPGTGTSDSIPAMLSNGEYVVRASSVSKYGVAALDAINQGAVSDLRYYAGGGLVDSYSVPVAMRGLEKIQVEIDSSSAGPAGAGAIGGGWQTIWNIVKAVIPQARINSTYRPGDPGYHGKGKAIDFGFGPGLGGAGSAGLASIARFLYNGYGSTLAELIYDGIGDDTPDVKNGRPHTYDAGTRADHRNHVHAAVYDQGGLLPSGTAAVNLSGSPELVLNPAQTAAAMRSREFSGASGSIGAQTVVVEIAGAEIAGTLQMGGDGLMRIVDGRITQAVTVMKQRGSRNP